MSKIQPKTNFIGKNTIFLPTCHSTNDFCFKLISETDIINGTLVYTDFQTNGRGQRGNVWQGEIGKNIMASLILKTDCIKAQNQFDLNIIFSLALANVFRDLLGDGFKLKWPNDLYINDLKLGGVLIENTILGQQLNYSVIGFGININQESFENLKATSIKKITGFEVDRILILQSVLEKFEVLFLEYKMKGIELLRTQYLEILLGMNEKRIFQVNETSVEGRIIGINEIGQLLVEIEQVVEVFSFKEIGFVFD